jgi:hypothetical protein
MANCILDFADLISVIGQSGLLRWFHCSLDLEGRHAGTCFDRAGARTPFSYIGPAPVCL